jgi:tetratricopeptide (TPR) repeat protein
MDNRADFKLLAKAFGRIGKAYAAQDDFDNAIRYYDKALTNHRVKDYLTPKQAVSGAVLPVVVLDRSVVTHANTVATHLVRIEVCVRVRRAPCPVRTARSALAARRADFFFTTRRPPTNATPVWPTRSPLSVFSNQPTSRPCHSLTL